MSLEWKDKVDGDIIYAEDINEIAHAAQDAESKPWASGSGAGSAKLARYSEANGDNSIAVGYRGETDDGELVATQANGMLSVSHGVANVVHSVNGIAFGQLNEVGDASDDQIAIGAFVSGTKHKVKGSQSATFGRRNKNFGSGGHVSGTENTGGTDDQSYIDEIPSAGTNVFVAGCENQALGAGAFVANEKNTGYGRDSATLGVGNKNYAYAGIALGMENEVGNSDMEYDHYGLYPHKNKAAVAIGRGLKANGDGEVALGKFNQTMEELNESGDVELIDTELLVGTGVSDAIRNTPLAVGRGYVRYSAKSEPFISHGTNLIVIPFDKGSLPKDILKMSDTIRIFHNDNYDGTPQPLDGEHSYITAVIDEIWNETFSGGVSDAIRISAVTAKFDDGSSATDFANTNFVTPQFATNYKYFIPKPVVLCDNVTVRGNVNSDTALIGSIMTNKIRPPRDSIYGDNTQIDIYAAGGVTINSYNKVDISSYYGLTISSQTMVSISAPIGVKISNLMSPTTETDAVPKKYVDEIVAKLTAAIEALGGAVT